MERMVSRDKRERETNEIERDARDMVQVETVTTSMLVFFCLHYLEALFR